MAIFKVVKRNWAIVTFDWEKIKKAIKNAIIAAGGNDFSQLDKMLSDIIQTVHTKYEEIPTVEQIQDTVEEVLIKEWHDSVAKKFILYREERRKNREKQNVVIEVGNTMEEYLQKSDWRINANANSGYSLWGLILNTSGKITANYWLSHVYPSESGNLHRNGDIHIHDLDMFCGYCAGWSLRQLLEEWFNWLPNRVESAPPKNLQAAVNQMINFLWTLQNEWAWAQAFSSFDTYLAPFVHKHKKEVEKELDDLWVQFVSEEARTQYIYKKTYKYVTQQMQNLIFWLNVPSRWGTQTPFTNITLDLKCPEDLADKALLLGWIDKWYYEKKYWELEDEMILINKVLVDVYTKWDSKWNVFTFPIPTYNITPDFPWEEDYVDGIFEMTAKYWIPYFQNFVGSQFKRIKDENGNWVKEVNPDAYTPGAVRSMCCRLQLDLKELLKRWNWLFGSAEMTWSIWVVTINLARIWYNCAWNKKAFFDRVEYLMHQWKTTLEIKRKEVTKWLDAGLFPYTKRYLHSFRNHFSTIWINWMNEAVLNFTKWAEDLTWAYGRDFALEVMEFMREKLKEYQEETGNLYNLEATPAEWTTYRFAKEDKKQIPDIIQAWVPEAPYYTNSTHIPVWYTSDAFEALDLQNELQTKYTWGTVLHLYLAERLPDAEACKALVKKTLENYQLPYITISPTFSICPKHGYIAWEHDFCPKCDAENGYVGDTIDREVKEFYNANK